MASMHVPKRSPRLEYRLKQRERIEASPLLAEKFPGLKALTVSLEFFDSAGRSKQGEMECRLNMERAKSAVWFDCPGAECVGGDFDLSEALREAVAAGHKVVTGERRCQGMRNRWKLEAVVCGTVLRYKVTLNYD